MANGQRLTATYVRCHSNFEENNSDSDTEDDFIKQEEQPSNLENGELKEKEEEERKKKEEEEKIKKDKEEEE